MERTQVGLEVMENWQNWKTGKLIVVLAESLIMTLNSFSDFHEDFFCRREKYNKLFSCL